MGIRRVACSGGVFMNVKANQAILSLPEVEELFVFPSCGDETNSIGAAYWVYSQERLARHEPLQMRLFPRSTRGPRSRTMMWRLRYASQSSAKSHVPGRMTSSERRLSSSHKGSIVARAKGPMEFGARTLGNRSILADPRSPAVIRTINEMIKRRDFWMPFAPSVLSERAIRLLY